MFSLVVRYCLLVFFCSQLSAAWAETAVKVGIYQNEPKVFLNREGQADGFFPRLLDRAAEQEGWTLDYVPCQWDDCLDKLQRGEIDLMPDVAYSNERAGRFLLSKEVVLSSWSVVYVRKGVDVPSLKELQGKSLAVVKGSIQYQALALRLRKLGVHVTFHEVNGFGDVFRLVKIGWVDAGLVNIYFGRRHADEFGLQMTNILAKPSLLMFAAAPGRQALLNALDARVRAWKDDPDSFYYQNLHDWFSPLEEGRVLPVWIKWLFGIAFLAGLVLLFLVLLFRSLVQLKTRELEDKARSLEHLANHDLLTGLPNRKLFFDRLKQALRRVSRSGDLLAVLYIDLDQFKQINDSFGHEVGDDVLKEVSKRLRASIREQDTIARLGGDEFAIVMEALKEPESTMYCVKRLQEALDEPLGVEPYQFIVTISIGISLYPQDGQDAHTLLRNADTAMFKAKEAGRSTFQYYVEEMTRAAIERSRMEADMHRALQEGQFRVCYQPQICLRTGRVVGFEALARWHHPQHGEIPPGQFIPLAEDTGLILALGEWVMRTACRQFAQWRKEGMDTGLVSVNISALQLRGYALLDMVRDVVRETGFQTDWLELELTESFIMSHTQQAISVMTELRGLGVSLAVDDFGTGYSSLAYLKQLPLSKLKIDRSFITGIPEDENDVAIVRAIIALGKTLNLKIIAEGVEGEEQEEMLRQEQCDEVQGYFYARALEPDEAREFLLAAGQGAGSV
ncbi:EAL domain-containing protein [Thiolapillus brandeum]|nr:EAL domain-containing protein [Thiolapillus brandeum]